MWNLASLIFSVRLASFALRSVNSIEGHIDKIRSWRYGELEFSDGNLVAVYPRWWPRVGSEWESVRDSDNRTLSAGLCRVYYAFPVRAPGFMSVLYALSGPNTQYKTIYRAVCATDEIAKLHNAQAIVCQMVSGRGSERLMKRWGYVRHASTLGENHYIKRLR